MDTLYFRIRNTKTGDTLEFSANSPQNYCDVLGNIYQTWPFHSANSVVDELVGDKWIEAPVGEIVPFEDLPKDIQEQIQSDFKVH